MHIDPDTIPPLNLNFEASQERQQREREIIKSIQMQCRVLKAARRMRLTPAQLAAAPEAPF